MPLTIHRGHFPKMEPTYRGLKSLPPRFKAAIPGYWENPAENSINILRSPVQRADVVFSNGKLTGGPELKGNNSNKIFRERADFEEALLQLVRGLEVVDPVRKRTAGEEIVYVNVKKNGPVVRVTRGTSEASPEIVLVSSKPSERTSLEVFSLRRHTFDQVRNWEEGEDTRMILGTSRFVGARPFAMLFDDIQGLGWEQTLSSRAVFWSTHPETRFGQIIEFFQNQAIPEKQMNNPFWQALAGELRGTTEKSFFPMENPVLVWMGEKPIELGEQG